ncbi:hypothetical protein [Erysipelothrix rhusiopathiae]
MGDAVGVSKSTVSRWEAGKKFREARTLVRFI